MPYFPIWKNGIPIFNFPLLLSDGSAAAPSLAFASDPDTGWFTDSANTVSLSLGGAKTHYFSTVAHGFYNDGAKLVFGTVGDAILGREAAAVWQLGADAAGVTNQMFKGPDRITSDGVGGDLTIAGGRNLGASAGGSIIFQTSPAAGAGVTGTLATALTIDSTKKATFAGALDAVSYAVGAAAGASFGPAGVTSITVVNGIVTAIS